MFVRQVYAAAATVGDLTVTGTLGVTGASTLTGDIAAGNINMASGKVLKLDAGTAAACSLQFAGSSAGTGLSAQVADVFRINRQAVSQVVLDAACTLGGGVTTTMSGSTVFSLALRPNSVAVQTSDYTVLNSSCVVPMNVVAGGTATLPSAPATNQEVWVANYSANSMTLARNGKTINGAAADLTLLTNTGVALQYNLTEAGWRVLGRFAVV